jgi:hypothetical protein
MNYEKPEIAVVGDAINAVQGSLAKISPATDHNELTTVAAYQSDEQ